MITLTWTTNNPSSTSTFSVSNIPTWTSGAVIYATLEVADGYARVDNAYTSSYINWDGSGGVNSKRIDEITVPYTFYLGRMGLSVTITNISSAVWSIINNINVNSSPTDNPVIHTDDGYQIGINNIITPLQNIVETNTMNRITYNLYTSTYGYKRKNNLIQLPKWDSNYHFENSKYDLQSLYRLNNNNVRNGYSCKTGYYPNQDGMNKNVNQWGKIIIPCYRQRVANILQDIQKRFRIWKNGNYLYIRRCSDENGTAEETTWYDCKSNSIILDLVACGGQGGYGTNTTGGGGGGGAYIRAILDFANATDSTNCFEINLDQRYYSNNQSSSSHIQHPFDPNQGTYSTHWCSLRRIGYNNSYICLQCGSDGIDYVKGNGGRVSVNGENNINNMLSGDATELNSDIVAYNSHQATWGIKILQLYFGKSGGYGSSTSPESGDSFSDDDPYNSCGDTTTYRVYSSTKHGVGGKSSATYGGGGGASALGCGSQLNNPVDTSGDTGYGAGGRGGNKWNGNNVSYGTEGQQSCAILHW